MELLDNRFIDSRTINLVCFSAFPHLRLLPLILVLATAITAITRVQAADVIIDIQETSQNGGRTLNDGDKITISENGSITTATFDLPAIDFSNLDDITVINNGSLITEEGDSPGIESAASNNVVITNNGTIYTEGSSSEGVWYTNSSYTLGDGGHNLVTNNGSITTEGGAVGIYVSGVQDVKVNNSGSITTLGSSGNGIELYNVTNGSVYNTGTINSGGFGIHNYDAVLNAQGKGTLIFNSGAITSSSYSIYNRNSDASIITNTGTATTTSDNAYAIYNRNSDNVEINNSGTIKTSGAGGLGIFNFSSNQTTLVNNGSIITSGANSLAAYMDGDNTTTTNTGVLHTSGANAMGIYINGDDNEVSNSGYIVSELSNSLFLTGTGNVLNLMDPAYLGGAIVFNNPTTVNINTGPSHSVYWTFDSDINGRPNVSGNTPWFYDETAYRFATYDPTTLASGLDAAADAADLLSRVGRNQVGSQGLWATTYSAVLNHDRDNAILEREVDLYGFTIGYADRSDNFDWNTMIGTLNTKASATSTWAKATETDSKGWFVGAHGNYVVGNIDIEAGVLLSFLNNDSSRFINDNLAETGGLTLGIGRADASYNSTTLMPEIGLSYVLSEDNGWQVSPAARLRYVSQWTESFTETGSDAAATVASSQTGLWEADAELNLERSYEALNFSSSVGYTFRRASGNSTEVSIFGITDKVKTDYSTGSAYLDINLAYSVSDNTSLQLGVTTIIASGGPSGAMVAGVQSQF